MEQRFGIQETTEAVLLGCALAAWLDNSLDDKKINAADYLRFLSVVPLIKGGIEGVQVIPHELGELSDDEKAQVLQAVATSLKLRVSKVEIVAKHGLETILSLVQTMNAYKEVKKG